MYVVTAGTFDLLHEGHLNLLDACATIGFPVHVMVNGDGFVYDFKGMKPVQNENTRLRVIKSLKQVTFAEIGPHGYSLKDRLEDLHKTRDKTILVVGSDWATKDYARQIGMSVGHLKDLGCTLVYVPYTHGISTTALRGKL